ncbi:MAG: hypothetical protein AAFY59_00455 [Pseudomonadota bacterium]
MSIIAGGIGASAASGLLPRVALRGSANIAAGLVAGTLVWMLSRGLMGAAADELTTLMMTLGFSAAGGAGASFVLGYLARLFDKD